jgi:folate-binding Fe-S cluster repair protein YgfZ
MMRFPHRSLIRLTGPDTIALLERTVTNSVKDWAAGEVRYGALLTPQGKIISDYTVLRTDDGVLLDVHEDAAEDLAKRLKMFRLRARVEITLDDTSRRRSRPDDAATRAHPPSGGANGSRSPRPGT